MLERNVAGLRLATGLLQGTAGAPSPAALVAAREALADMSGRTASAQARFAPGTPHHALQANRLRALRAGQAAVAARLAGPSA